MMADVQQVGDRGRRGCIEETGSDRNPWVGALGMLCCGLQAPALLLIRSSQFSHLQPSASAR